MGFAREKKKQRYLSPDSGTKQSILWAEPTLRSAAGIATQYLLSLWICLAEKVLIISDLRYSTIKI
ncbi:hypothetical protein [Neisseria mucosa]|uniref:hypothetical protein n=1 Tax=Neisseria mucosa TaxID=488 RepID=UPI001924AC2F|nr:hypothetical protein [Neisseria mucosa]